MARNSRRFLARVVRYLADDCGIRQFIDNGRMTGLIWEYDAKAR